MPDVPDADTVCVAVWRCGGVAVWRFDDADGFASVGQPDPSLSETTPPTLSDPRLRSPPSVLVLERAPLPPCLRSLCTPSGTVFAVESSWPFTLPHRFVWRRIFQRASNNDGLPHLRPPWPPPSTVRHYCCHRQLGPFVSRAAKPYDSDDLTTCHHHGWSPCVP